MDIVTLQAARAAAKRDGNNIFGRKAGGLAVDSANPKTNPFPDFVRTGQIFSSAAATGLVSASSGGVPSIYWPKTIDITALTWAPAPYLTMCSTDHGYPGGMAVTFHATPYAAGTWSPVVVTGMPANWTSFETPTPIVDVANNRLIVIFQAAETTTQRQNSHILATTNGTTWIWLSELPQMDNFMMGDGHGGYCGSPFPYGDGWGLFSLSGGTNYASSVLRVSTDLVNWTHASQQIPYTDPTRIIEWFRSLYFTWRGQHWTLRNSTPPVSGVGASATYTVTVCRVAADMRTPLSRPVVTLTGNGASTDNAIESIVPFDGKLVALYRDGGQSGSIKIAVAEG